MNRNLKHSIIFAIVVLVSAGVLGAFERFRGPSGPAATEVAPASVTKSEEATSTPSGTTQSPLPVVVAAEEGPLSRSGVIARTNAERSARGLSTLRENSFLDRAAERKLEDMFQQQYFEHVSPQGVGPGALVDKVGYDYVVVAENLALGSFKDSAAVVAAWMASSGHRANILDDRMSEIGVAAGKGTFKGERVWIIVQEFGKPLTDCPMVDMALRTSIDRRKGDVDAMERELTALKDAIERMPRATPEESDAYNAKVSEYNSLVSRYNKDLEHLRIDIDAYNQQIQAFNACAK